MADDGNYGKGYSPRKSMAMGEGGHGNFGVGALPGSGRPAHPDVGKTFGVDHMPDAKRGAGPGVGGGKGYAMQARPDHGDTGMDHHRRGPKA